MQAYSLLEEMVQFLARNKSIFVKINRIELFSQLPFLAVLHSDLANPCLDSFWIPEALSK